MGCRDTLPPGYQLFLAKAVDTAMPLVVLLVWTYVAIVLVALLRTLVALMVYTIAAVILAVILWPVVVVVLWWLGLDLTIRCLGLERTTRISTRNQAHVRSVWLVVEEAAVRGEDVWEAMQAQLAVNVAAMQARQQQWSLRGGGLSSEADLGDLDESTAVEIALAESLDQARSEASRVEEAHASMAEYCHIFPVEPSGWCFFDCVAKQVGKDGLEAGPSRLGVAAAVALEALLRRKDMFGEK